MTKDSNIIIRIDSNIKKDFQEIINKNGYNATLVLNSFIYDVIENKKIPDSILERLKPIKNHDNISIPFIKKCLSDIMENFPKKKEVKKIYLFGSYARGEENFASDIDIRMELTGNISFFDIVEISDSLERKTGKKIDLVTSNNLDERFYNEIKKDEICLYE